MKYNWDYTIKIKTKDGTYEYERDDVLEAVKLVEQHPDYQEFYMQHNKPKCDKCHIQLNEVFIQQNQNRTYKLCKRCNQLYLKYNENVKRLKKIRDGDSEKAHKR